jgi:pimeloyl-ACP methyl ester carboxylesterase
MLLAALMLTSLVTPTAAPAISWDDCANNPAVQCATITVPIDYAHPETGTIDLSIARIKATGKRQGTLMYMPGGPGDSGVDRLQRENPVVPAVAERFDVVSFDPRGTNRSHPVVCDADLLADLPNVAPDAGAQLADVQAYSRELGNNCRERTGPLIDHVDSVSVARDIDMIRAALGERKITLYGRSYGTLAGQMYAENFPHRVRGLVLDSVFDHSLSTSKLITQQAATTEDSFVGFARWCATDTTCVLHGQDVGQVYADLYERSLRGELPLPPVMLQATIFTYLYGPDWPGAADELKELTESAPATRAATAPFTVAVFCADHRVPISSQDEWMSLWRKMNAATPTMRTHRAWLALSLCSAWPADTPNPQHRTDAAGPFLLMNAAHDPASSHVWAQNVRRQLTGSVLLTYDGYGHGVTNRTDCTEAVFTNYVVNGKLPRPGTHCAAA